MRWITALCALLLAGPAKAEESGGTELDGLWAGHIVVKGKRILPFFGNMEPRTDTFVLASLRQEGDSLSLVQRPCLTQIAPVAGARMRFLPGADERLPTASLRFSGPMHALVAPAWQAGWEEEDLDQDGQPGLTVLVSAPMCSGSVAVASTTVSQATGALLGDALRGEISVTVQQRILGATGACLRMVAHDSRDRMAGTFAYTRVPTGTSCASIADSWPIRAD